MSLLTIALAALTLGGCEKQISDPLEFQIIQADTVKVREDLRDNEVRTAGFFVSDELTFATAVVPQKSFYVNTINKDGGLEKLRNPDIKERGGNSIIYKAIGSSLTAGVRDGGYFNEGMETSFAAILARQLGVANFKQPLFKPENYNGFGRKVATDFNPIGGPFQKYAISQNNLGINADGSLRDIIDGDLTDFDNLGVIGSSPYNIHWHFNEERNLRFERFSKWGKSQGIYGPFGYNNLLSKLSTIEADFITFEYTSVAFRTIEQKVLNIPRGSAPFGNFAYGYDQEPFEILLDKIGSRSKAIFLNAPDASSFPAAKQIDAKKKEEYYNLLESLGTFNYSDITVNELINNVELYPSTGNDSLFSKKVNILLKSKNQFKGMTKNAVLSTTIEFNERLLKFASRINAPVVDIFSLYEKINKGEFVTHDGILVDPSMKGNFYSSDGLYPSAFGNAIIANECINTINRHYKTNIPLVPTRIYLSQEK